MCIQIIGDIKLIAFFFAIVSRFKYKIKSFIIETYPWILHRGIK